MNVPCGPAAQCPHSAIGVQPRSLGSHPDSNSYLQRSSSHDILYGSDEEENLDSAATFSVLSASRPDAAAYAYPPGFRCLVTLEEGPVLKVCHLISKSTTDGMLRRLEHFWGMQPETLNLDTSRNIMILRSDLKLEFDNLAWVLMPSEGLLDQILEWQRNNLDRSSVGVEPGYLKAFPNQDDWEYIFVPFRLQAPISRHHLVGECLQHTHSNAEGENKGGNYDQNPDEDQDQAEPSRDKESRPEQRVAEESTADLSLNTITKDEPSAEIDVFQPPYEDFPRIKSHIHPFFVIYAAAQAYQRNTHLVLAPEYDELGYLVRKIKQTWEYYDIPPLSKIRNKRAPPGKANGRAHSKRQRTTLEGCPHSPDQSLRPKSTPLNLLNLELQASLLSKHGPSRANPAASNPQVLQDSGVTAWVNDVVIRTHSGQLEPFAEAPFPGDTQETPHPLFPESWHSWVNDVHLPKARGLVSS